PPPSHSTHPKVTPRIIIHGGAGNLTRTTLPQPRYDAYLHSLHSILSSSTALLANPTATALDIATHAVSMLEDDPLYNSGRGAVFTRSGTQELECSMMISNGYRKRGIGCMLLRHVKNPIKLARELLIRGEREDGGGGARDHCQYSGEEVERLAREWGLEMRGREYFWTRERWEEHVRGLKEEERKKKRKDEWEKSHYIPLGTCGAVVLDSFGTVCVATSTGGLTNKLPGRIGDTPTLGAGFWAEEWFEKAPSTLPQAQLQAQSRMIYQPSPSSPSPPSQALNHLSRGDLRALMGQCLPTLSATPIPSSSAPVPSKPPATSPPPPPTRHAIALSGTGNGDTFLRLCSSRTVAAESRFSHLPLSTALSNMAGQGGALQKSAGDRWGRVHEGVGGMIGIEVVGEKAEVVWDYNCGGMFRAWNDEDGRLRCAVFKGEGWESG
ncbi:nucleophile aminohydrolase, partial [Clohesyomyces aquaticus]